MTRPAVVVGASLAGLATALALAEQGHPVRVLEHSAPPPDGPIAKAAESWRRPTVPQGGHSHILTSLGVRALRQRASHLLETALEEGARLLDLTEAAPRGAGREGVVDHELVALATRRPLFDLLLYRAVQARPRVVVDHGATVRGLLLESNRIRGVVTHGGTHVPARFVVDATGRRARARSWLTDAGIPAGDDLTDPTRLRVFTRFYQLNTPEGALPGPLNRGNAAGGVWDHYAAVVHPADNGTFGVTVGVLAGDPATTGLSKPTAFTAVARRSPHVGQWVGERVATPLTGVRTITMPPNILRSAARPGQRQTAGLFPIGDAACVTDPVYGRGMSLALEHAFRLADLLGGQAATDPAQSESAVHLADEIYRPWYEQSVRDSRERTGLWRAAADGAAPAGPSPLGTPDRLSLAQVAMAAAGDAALWRGLVRVLMCLDIPADVFHTAAFRDRVRNAPAAQAPQNGGRPPTRPELLAAIAEAGD